MTCITKAWHIVGASDGRAGLKDPEFGPMNHLRLNQETMGKIRFQGGNRKRLGNPPPQRQEEVRQFWKALMVGGHGAGALVDSKLGAKQVERAIFLARWQRPRCGEHASSIRQALCREEVVPPSSTWC